MRLLLALILSLSCFSVQAHVPVTKPVIKKAKLLRSNPHRFTAIHFAGTNPWTEVDDEDIVNQRRYRSRLEKEIEQDLSDYIKTRLLIARTRALKKFAETHTDLV